MTLEDGSEIAVASSPSSSSLPKSNKNKKRKSTIPQDIAEDDNNDTTTTTTTTTTATTGNSSGTTNPSGRQRRRMESTSSRFSKEKEVKKDSWGFMHVLKECGLISLIHTNIIDHDERRRREGSSASNNGNNRGGTSTYKQYGCQMEDNVSPSSLRASIYTLLKEMDKSGVDSDNSRVIDSMEELITSGEIPSCHDDGEEEGDADVVMENGNNTIPYANAVLRQMLLPLYCVKNVETSTDGEDDDDKEEDNNDTTNDILSTTSPTSTITSLDSSLMRVLLRIDTLQPSLLTCLMQKLTQLASADQETNASDQALIDSAALLEQTRIDEELPRLIMSHIRWLDHVLDPSMLTKDVVECLSIISMTSASEEDSSTFTSTAANASSSATRQNKEKDRPNRSRSILLELIATLPDIVDEYSISQEPEQMDTILSTLRDVRVQDPTLLIPCLDAVSALCCTTQEQLEGVIMDAMEALETIEESWLLPALTKFLVQTIPNANMGLCQQVIGTFRRLRLGEEDTCNKSSRQDNCAAEALMLEALSQGLQYRSDLTNVLLNTIKAASPEEHETADIWLLLCCAAASHNKTKVKSILKAKAISGCFTAELMSDAIHGNGIALAHLFQNSILYMADLLVRSLEREVRTLGSAIYQEVYKEFSSRIQRQELVGQLVIHIGSGSEEEMDAGMKVFTDILLDGAEGEGAKSLRPFLPFLTSLLDNIQQLRLRHLRKLFILLFAVGEGGDQDGNDVGEDCNDVHIVIRKYLSLPQMSMKHIGIIGACCFAVVRSAKFLKDDSASNEEEEMPPALGEVIRTLDMVHKFCTSKSKSITQNTTSFNMRNSRTNGSALSLFFDELCLVVQGKSLAPTIKMWIMESFGDIMENSFLGDLDNDTQDPDVDRIVDKEDKLLVTGGSRNLRAPRGELRFNIDQEESFMYMKCLPLHASENVHQNTILPQQLCPLLRLLATCNDVRYGGEGVSEIDAVLGCPILLPSEHSCGIEFELLSDVQKWTTATTMFTAVSWCRELINSFVHAAAFRSAFSLTQSQTMSQMQIDVRVKVIKKLKCLIELDSDLRRVSSKCYQFAPPTLEPLPIPTEFVELKLECEGEPNDDEVIGRHLASKMSKEEKQALAKIKKEATKRESARLKNKQKLLKLKSKFEATLVTRTQEALRPLDPKVCIALGFPEIRACTGRNKDKNGRNEQDEIMNEGVGGPLTTLLLTQLQTALKKYCLKSKNAAIPRFAKRSGQSQEKSSIIEDSMIENPYDFQTKSSDVQPGSLGFSRQSAFDSVEVFEFLDACVTGHVFVSVHEYLTLVAEINGQSSDFCDEIIEVDQDRLQSCILLLLQCVMTMLDADNLYSSPKGNVYLEVIMKQLSVGCEVSKIDFEQQAHQTSSTLSSMAKLSELVEEIVICADSKSIAMVMEGVNCLDKLLRRANLLIGSDDNSSMKDASRQMKSKLSKLCDKLLQREWHEETKLNKSNVGRLVTLFIEHCFNAGDSQDEFDSTEFGRIRAIWTVLEILEELVTTEECKGPVESYPTCSASSFTYYYSAALTKLPIELASLFDSPLPKQDILKVIKRLVEVMKSLFELTKNNPCLAKRQSLMTQLKFGSTFIEIFIQKAAPLLETCFEKDDQMVQKIIVSTHTITKQMNVVISHGKREKDANISKEAPRVRKICEMFIHKMKSLLRKNDALDAFWGGNLKERHLDGSIVETVSKEEVVEAEENIASEEDSDNDSSDEEKDSDTESESQ